MRNHHGRCRLISGRSFPQPLAVVLGRPGRHEFGVGGKGWRKVPWLGLCSDAHGNGQLLCDDAVIVVVPRCVIANHSRRLNANTAACCIPDSRLRRWSSRKRLASLEQARWPRLWPEASLRRESRTPRRFLARTPMQIAASSSRASAQRPWRGAQQYVPVAAGLCHAAVKAKGCPLNDL